MNSPFLNGGTDGLENTINTESSPGTIPGAGVSQESSLGNASWPVSPRSGHQEEIFYKAGLVHSQSDEQLPLRSPNSPPPYTNTPPITPWIFGGGAPELYSFTAPPQSPGVLPSQYLNPMVHGVGSLQQGPLPPWRAVLYGGNSGDYQSTLCPTQLVLAPKSLYQEETPTSLNGWDSESLSIASDSVSGPSQARRPTDEVGHDEPDEPSSSQPGKQRRSLPDSRPPFLDSPEPPSVGTPSHNQPTSSSRRPRSRPARRNPLPTGPARTARDAFLLRCRAEGMSYKQLKEHGNLPEAESTLRGRYRALTKSKQERVRRPVWTDRDVSSSFTAVGI